MQVLIPIDVNSYPSFGVTTFITSLFCSLLLGLFLGWLLSVRYGFPGDSTCAACCEKKEKEKERKKKK